MKIIAFSDTHQQTLVLPKGDVLIHAGDWCTAGKEHESEQFLNQLEDIAFNYKHIICTAGNHERHVESNQAEVKKKFSDRGFHLLIDEELVIDGIKFYGFPWTPPFFNWAYMAEPDKLQFYADQIPADTDVLISHGPPQFILDKTASGKHIGSEQLYTAIERVQPKLVICGHNHEGHGIQMLNKTMVANVSILNERYTKVYGPTVIYI